jgi:hypothetical protein
VCVCVCTWQIPRVCNWITEDIFSKLRWYAVLFPSNFLRCVPSVLSWLQAEAKDVREPNYVIFSLENLKETLECFYVPERSYRKYFLDWSEFLGPRGAKLQVIIVQYCTEFRTVCSSAWKRWDILPTMKCERDLCQRGGGICAAWILLLRTSATRSPMHYVPLSHIASW